MSFKLCYLDNLDMFYNLCKNQEFIPLFHGTKKYAVECDPIIIEMMHKHCINILLKAKAHFKSVDNETYDKYWAYKKASEFKYFASEFITTFGNINNFQYGDFYMTRFFDETFLLRFTSYGFGEIGRFTYDNIMGLKHFNINIDANESIDFFLKHYPEFLNSEPVVLILNDYNLDELKSEGGNKVYEFENNVNFRLSNPFNKNFYVIKQSLFEEAVELFDEEHRKIFESKLNHEEALIGKGWLHDIFYSGHLIEYKRDVPKESYRYSYIYTTST